MLILVGGEKGGTGKSCLTQNMAVILQRISEPPRAYAHGIKSALSRVQAALAPNLLSPVARYISL